MINIADKSIKFSLWLSEKDYDNLKIKSEKAGIYKAVFIRNLINGIQIEPKNCEHHRELVHKLAGLCNNANQLAFKANSTGAASKNDVDNMIKIAQEAYTLVKGKW